MKRKWCPKCSGDVYRFRAVLTATAGGIPTGAGIYIMACGNEWCRWVKTTPYPREKKAGAGNG